MYFSTFLHLPTFCNAVFCSEVNKDWLVYKIINEVLKDVHSIFLLLVHAEEEILAKNKDF